MYPPHHLGGYELSCRDVVERWRLRGHEVHVLTSTMRVPGVADPPGERARGVHRDLRFYYADNVITSPPIRRRLAIERGNQRVLDRTMDAVRPEVVSVWHMGAMSQALLTTVERRGLPMVVSACDDWLVYGPRVDPWIRAFVRRPAMASIVARLSGVPTRLATFGPQNAFCFNSDFVRQRALDASPYGLDVTTVVYSGIDLRDFPITDDPVEPWRWRLLCVGRQEERKGTHTAIAALADLPADAQLAIVGPSDEDYVARLRALAGELGVTERVSFDVVDRASLRRRYADADAFLFPVTWDEPFGLVPVEAMACGTPVIATGTGGSAEFLIDGVNCLLVPKDDPRALAEALRRLADDDELRAHLIEGGRATAAELTVDRLADTLEAWHLAAANGFRDGRPADLPLPASSLRAR